MVNLNFFPKLVVATDAKSVIVKEIDVCKQFTTGQEFEFRNDMLQWIQLEASKLGFGVIIGKSYNGSDRRTAFVTMRCKISWTYRTPL